MATLSIRTDDVLKEQVQNLCKEMGISLSSLVNGLLKRTVQTRKVEFVGLTENGFTPEYEKEILDYVNSESYKNGNEVAAVCKNWEENEKYLRSLM